MTEDEHRCPWGILLVDDHADIRRLIRFKIERRLFVEIQEADSPIEAIREFGRGRFDLIIWSHSDWLMGIRYHHHLLDRQTTAQFLMVVNDRTMLPKEYLEHFRVVQKDDFDLVTDSICNLLEP